MSNHAELRKGQRGVTEEDIDFVIKYGELFHQNQRVVFTLTRKVCSTLRKQLPKEEHRSLDRCKNLSVIITNTRDEDTPEEVTVIKSTNYRRIRKHQGKALEPLVV